MIERGAKPPTTPVSAGEAATFAMVLHMNPTFRPTGWKESYLRWLKGDNPYLSETLLDYAPAPMLQEVLDYLPKALADEYVDLQIAACHVARKHPRPEFREPLQRILDRATETHLRKYAVDAARANGLKAKYDANAPFVDAADLDP